MGFSIVSFTDNQGLVPHLLLHLTSTVVTLRNEVAKVMFLHLSVSHSVHRGGVPGQVPPGTRYTPHQVPPLGPGTPPGRYTPQAGTPQDQVHPQLQVPINLAPSPQQVPPSPPPGTRYTPQAGTPPPWDQAPPGQTATVADGMFILLECILVNLRSLGQGNVFTPVCHSVHRGDRGVCPDPHPQAYLEYILLECIFVILWPLVQINLRKTPRTKVTLKSSKVTHYSTFICLRLQHVFLFIFKQLAHDYWYRWINMTHVLFTCRLIAKSYGLFTRWVTISSAGEMFSVLVFQKRKAAETDIQHTAKDSHFLWTSREKLIWRRLWLLWNKFSSVAWQGYTFDWIRT